VTDAFDYVVIGSGAAGASAARTLADATSSVAIVEEGPAVPTDQFSDRSFPTLARLYRDMGAQITRGRAPMLVIQGRCVGGSTVVNSAIVRRLPEEVWGEWRDGHHLADALPFAEIEAASADIERELQVAATPESIWGGNNRLLSRAARLGGVAGSPTQRNAPGCRGSARCNLGCPNDAKQSMQLSYLPYAVARGARVFSDERAERVVLQGGRAVRVDTQRRSLVARRAVVLAASAVETPRLLWRSGIRSRHVGRHFQGHPGMAIVGLFDQPVGLGRGATQGFELDGLRSGGRIKVETLATAPETFFGGLPGVGREWLSLMAEFSRSAVWVLPLRSFAEGIVGVGRRDRSIDFRLDPRDLANLRRGLRHAAELMFTAGAREVVCPVHGLPHRLGPDQLSLIERAPDNPAAYPLAMSHLFGTARMSVRQEDGVVAPDFRVHGTPNLYVVDSSVFPTNLGVNPQLAIMTLARMAAARMIA
jgi:choline dehydrogenase-like flavoprotein